MSQEILYSSERARASLLAKLKESRELGAKQFPLPALLTLYCKSSAPLYLEYFKGLRLLVNWLGPISPSAFPIILLPRYLLTYEMQEIATITDNHISQIYQELTSLWQTLPQTQDF